MTEEHLENKIELDEIDWLLENLVEIVNKGVGFGITVLVDGVMISGHAVGGREYLRAMGETLAETFNKSPGIKEAFETLITQTYGAEDTNDEKEQPERKVGYLHLRDAKYIYPTSNISIYPQFRYVRIRLDQISAWFPGVAQ